MPPASQIIGEDTGLVHPQAYSRVGTANTANFWHKKKNPGPHNVSVAATNEFHGLELK